MHSLVASCRRTGDDVLHTGNLCRGDAHHGGGDVRIAPAWDIAPGRLYRNQALSCDKARRKFCLKLGHALKLSLRKLFNPLVSKLNIVPGPL